MVGNSLLCSNKHCFDISKLGYVNFALNQKQSKHYSRTSFESRMDILEKGYYSHILTEITHILSKLENITTILDVGCGEGYYSSRKNNNRCIFGKRRVAHYAERRRFKACLF